MIKKGFFLLVLVNALSLFSQDIEVKIYSNKSTVSENEIFKLSIEVSNANGFDFEEEPVFDPSIQVLKTEQSMNMSIINGRYSSSYIVLMYLKPTKKGIYKIGPLKLKIKNNIYSTNEIEITVTDQKIDNSEEESRDYLQKGADTQQKKSKSINLDYIIELTASKKEVFIDEGVDVAVNLYIRNQLQTINYTGLKLPSNAWIEKLEGKDNYAGRVIKNGLYYEHYIIENKRLFISKEGEYEIPPVVYNFYGVSGSSFFFFTEPMSIQTDPLTIKVKQLPKNMPDSFKGAVGDFKVNYSLTPQRLKTKESSTLTIVLEGEGNFHNIKEIGYKVYGDIDEYSSTQDIKTSNNKYKIKKWEILLVPSKPGKHKVVVNEFSFFNPATKSYVKIPAKEFELNVEKNEKDKDEQLIIHNQTDSKIDEKKIVLTDIGYIKTTFPYKGNIFNYSVWFILIISLYAILITYTSLFVLFKYAIFSKNKNIESFRKKSAYKEFIKEIDKIGKISKSGKEKIDDLVDKIYKIIEKYFVWKYGIKSVEFTSKGISDSLSKYLDEDKINKLKEYILHMDMIRFGGLEYSRDELEKLLNEIKGIIKGIEG